MCHTQGLACNPDVLKGGQVGGYQGPMSHYSCHEAEAIEDMRLMTTPGEETKLI